MARGVPPTFDVMRAVGAPPHLLRVFPRWEMDDVLADKAWSGPILMDVGEMSHDAIGLVDARTPLPQGMSEYDPADHQRASERSLSTSQSFRKPLAGECSQSLGKFV